MAKIYSSDLRSRVVAYVEAGHSRRAAARHFLVSDSFAVKLLQRVEKARFIRAWSPWSPAWWQACAV